MQTQNPGPAPRSPLLLAALAFAAGILIAAPLQRSPLRWTVSALLLMGCATAAIVWSSSRLAQVAALLSVACAGALSFTLRPLPRISTPPEQFLYSEPVEVTGYVISDGAFLPGSSQRERFDLRTENISLHGVSFTRPVGIRATLFSRQTRNNDEPAAVFPRLTYGERISFTAKLRLPRNFGNPGAFDYVSYLHALDISTLASVRVDELKILAGTSGSRLGLWRSAVRRSIIHHMTDQKLWSSHDAALFAAMVIGDDSLLLRDVREEFQKTGVYHLLVVSGMNVGLLAFAVFWLARQLRAPQWAASGVTIILAVFYAYIAGMGTPILRAVLMLSLFLLARLLYRDRAALNATGFAALAVLLLAPDALFEAGFQLTFLALLAISGLGIPVLERTSAPYRNALRHLESPALDLGLEPRLAQFRLDLRLVTARLSRFVGVRLARLLTVGSVGLLVAAGELTLVSFMTQAVLVLPMRVYFHRAALIGLPANLLVLPLAGILLNFAVAAVGLSYISSALARVVAQPAVVCLHWILRCLAIGSRLQLADWRVPEPGIAITIVAVAGIAAALFAVRRRRAVALAGLAALVLSSGVAAVYVTRPVLNTGKLEVTAIDVGQGDSLLVVSPEGRTMLIDAGGSIGPVRGEFDYGEDVVSPYLWARGLEKLDLIVLTHAHGDHIGGMARIIENFHPKELWVGINPETGPLDHLYAVAAAHHVAIRKHTAGDVMEWSGVHIRVLSPPPDWHPKSRPSNDDSLALLVSFGNTSALLAGDLEKKMERFISTESPRADLLKVAHHGSATSTTPELLAAAQPEFAVISDGYRNSFGHPRPEVLARLEEAHVRTYRTDMLGAVTFLLDGNRVERPQYQLGR